MAARSCTLEVTFQPAAIGARSATLNIPSNSLGESNVEVLLTGEGEFPASHDAFYPSGPQAFVEKGKLDGWELCFTGLYNGTESLDTVLTQCDGDPLLLAGGPTASSTLTVLAAARRADVIFDTGAGNDPHDANGSGWYYNGSLSWGFAKQGDPIQRTKCDFLETPNPELRLCWHTTANQLAGGWRAGAVTDLNESDAYTRYIYQAAPDLALGVKPGSGRSRSGRRPSSRPRCETSASSPRATSRSASRRSRPTGRLTRPISARPSASWARMGGRRRASRSRRSPKPLATSELKFTADGAGLETVSRKTKVIVEPN